jgi:hypothetical protein
MSENSGDVKFIDLFNPSKERSDKDLIEDRLAICNSCEWLRVKTQRCRKCGCFMTLKTTLVQAKCPLGKW